MTHSIALLNPPENPDDDGRGTEAQFVLQRRETCPPWCTGHHPSDADATFCAPEFYAWVDTDDDTVVVTASQDVGERAKVCLFPGDKPDRGGRYDADKARAIAALLVKGADLIDPPLAA